MGDIQTRPFSKNYSGLINQSVIGIGIAALCVAGQELMKRKRRGNRPSERLASRESWEFGYLFQGRSWARNPSPPAPMGWPLSWVNEVTQLSEEKMLELRGIDATLYVRFLRGCFWFALLHTFTTFPILLPIHVSFSGDDTPPTSMTRASISSLVTTGKGKSLLWIHICLLFWLTLTWVVTLVWVCYGAFYLRSAEIEFKLIAVRANATNKYYPHPHPQYAFTDNPLPSPNHPNIGLRLRTIMVSNVPPALRSEKDLKEYFQYYLSRKLDKPSMGIASSIQPGFLNKCIAFIFNKAKRLPAQIPIFSSVDKGASSSDPKQETPAVPSGNSDNIPLIERVVIVRKMTELASLLHRREEALTLLETAHIQLANQALAVVKHAMESKAADRCITSNGTKAVKVARMTRALGQDLEAGLPGANLDEETSMDLLIEILGPFVQEFNLQEELARVPGDVNNRPTRLLTRPRKHKTVWNALYSLPRDYLDPYQPLIHLNRLFRGKVVPSIDYYTAKLNMLTSLVTESRSRAVSDYEPVSTAFVTFADPADARRACKFLAVHPNNPLACIVTMAPMYHDLDWVRVMKSSFNTEFVKDWVVGLGVWGFTLFWIFPVSLLVGLVSIQNISYFWPSLKRYLDRHPWQAEVLQSFIPTVLVALLALLIPLILLLIAKKAYTITTLSALHDMIMTRYYKFLVVNVLVFFCVGTAALQSFLISFKSTASEHLLVVIADSFPTAGPFYVGWIILTAALHGGFELALIGLPLLMYPSTSRQVTPRKRATGIRPRTFNFYYWLPNHMLVLHVLLLFAVLNPVVLPFGALYFSLETGVIKNQFIHVYAKNYEGNGQLILIRVIRYSLDGLIFTQAVFLAYMVVLKKGANVGLAGFLIACTSLAKIVLTRLCRMRFEQYDIVEYTEICGRTSGGEPESETPNDISTPVQPLPDTRRPTHSQFLTWKMPTWGHFSYEVQQHRPYLSRTRHPNPFRIDNQDFPRLRSVSEDHLQFRPGDSHSNTQELPWGGPSLLDHNKVGRPINATEGCVDPVSEHPRPIAWDDQTTVDLPYDNPFYSRVYDNVLWLPRNPGGMLDLDDTVDFSVSLTIEVNAGKLGPWLSPKDFGSPEETPSGPSSPPGPYSAGAGYNTVDGTEEIDLPLSIASRIKPMESRTESRGLSRKMSDNPFRMNRFSFGVSKPDRNFRRPTISSDNVVPPVRHPFPSRTRQNFEPMRPSFSMPALQFHPMRRSSLAEPPSSPVHEAAPTFGDLSDLTSTRSSRVSAHQAILHEILAEERAAYINRMEEEQAESQRLASTQSSWLTSWMFTKRE